MTGESARLIYKSNVLDFDSALKRSHWEKDTQKLISKIDKISFGFNKNKSKFWLKIKNVDDSDSGRYSFVLNGTVLRLWQLHIQGNCVMCVLMSIKHQLSKVLQLQALHIHDMYIPFFCYYNAYVNILLMIKRKAYVYHFLVFFFFWKKLHVSM